MTGLADLDSALVVTATVDYKYDAANNRIEEATLDGTRTTWSYDDTNQLTGVDSTGNDPYTHEFRYDAVGNREVKIADGARTTSTYDVANQLKTAVDSTGTTTFMFDSDGNEQVVIAPGGGRTTTTWNFENQPILTVKPDGSRITTTYNADNRRVQKEE